MKKLTQCAAALLIGTLLSASAGAAEKTLVTVNGSAIPQSTADLFIAEQTAQGATDNAELRNAVREELIRRELLVQEAQKAGIDKKSDVIAQINAMRQSVLIRSFLQDYAKKHPVSDAQLKSLYETIKSQMSGTEYKARHVLVKDEAEAKAIIEKLKKGEKFADLAKQSIDTGTKDNGGELGWATPANFVKPFADALTSLSKGKFTETPVKTDFGYHVILLEDSRPQTIPSFDELKPRLQQQAQAEQISKMVEDLRAKAKLK